MELNEALENRRSIRHFKAKPVPDERLWEILRLANAAPSAGNLQAREFIVVRDEQVKASLATAALNQRFVSDAPVVIVVCGNKERAGKIYGDRGRKLYAIQDADAALMHMILTAFGFGLGTCWVGAFDDRAVSAVLCLPDHIIPIALIPLGYPDEEPEPTSRIEIEDLVHFEKW